MAEVVRRRYSRVLNEGIRKPGLIVVDGGRGQLSSACRELATLGLGDLPIIGLAKEREEIVRPGQSAQPGAVEGPPGRSCLRREPCAGRGPQGPATTAGRLDA